MESVIINNYYVPIKEYGGAIMENVKEKNNKLVIFIIQILVFVLLIGGVFFGTYYILVENSLSSYEKDVSSIIKDINNINDTMETYNSEHALNPEKLEDLRKNLPEYVENLTKIKNRFQNTVPTEKYKADYDNLINGLENNILIYRQAAAILENPEGKDVGAAAESLEKYRDECIKSYSNITSKGLAVSLPSGCLNFINNTLNYANEMARLTKDKEIALNQNMEFVEDIDLILSKFSPIRRDFSIELAKERSEGGKLNNIISLANKNSDEISDLKREFSNISVPSKALDCYKLLEKTIEDYESYLQKFIYSVKNESLSGQIASNESIDNLYKDCTNLFKTVTNDYNNFLKNYTQFKEVNLP